MPTDDDRSLLARYAAGDPAAFTTIVDRHGPLVWGVCRRATPTVTLAEDAFQAVFVVLARKARGLTLRTSLANWLFGVATRVARKAARREVRVKQIERDAVARRPRDNTAPEADRGGPEWTDVMRVLDEELGRLPDRLRGPLVACYLQGKTQDEAAGELGWRVFTLRRRLAEGREVLRERLTRRGATLAVALFAGAVFAGVGFAAPVPPNVVQTAVGIGKGVPVSGTVAALAKGVVGVPVAAKGALVMAGLLAVFGGVIVANRNRPDTATTPTTTTPTPVEPSITEPQWVTLRGRVVWPQDRDLPTPEVLNVTTDRAACCGDGELLSNRLLVDAKTRGVRNVVVWLRPAGDGGFPADRVHPDLKAPPPVLHEIDQPACQFEPRVVAARAGDSLLVKNSANIAHNVNCRGCGLDYNRTLPASKSEERGPLAADPTPAAIKCDIHPWMEGRLRVFDHPYFAVTREDGSFEMRLVPAGNWQIVYWHELGFHRGKAGATGLPVEVTGKELEPVEIEWVR